MGIFNFKSLNYNSVFLFKSLLISRREKKNRRKIKYLSKYLYAINNELSLETSDKYNNPIWQLWLQGKENMPPIVKFCTESIIKQNPDRNIILVTNKNLSEYVTLPEHIIKKYNKGIISHTHYSDIIRLFLLCKYGGTWIDSTVYMTDKMPKFILESEFFVPKDLTASLITPKTTLEQFIILNNKMNFGAFNNSISFIHSKSNNELLKKSLKIIIEYWKYENKPIDYLFFSYILTMVIFSKEEYKEIFIKAPYKLTTVEYGCLQGCLYEPFNKELFETIKTLTPIHKLVYKNQDKNIYKDSFFNYFISQLGNKEDNTDEENLQCLYKKQL